jgi:hypothetical protein
MKGFFRLSLVILAVLVMLFGLGLALRGVETGARAAPAAQLIRVTQPAPGEVEPPLQERLADPDQPAISFIDSPAPTCYRPANVANACYVTFSYLQVFASSSQYIITMTVAIDGRLRANYQGFFQNSMTVPTDFASPGFKVACGSPGASGNPKLGNSYSYVIRARETGGLSSANYGTVSCPPMAAYTLFTPVNLKR